ncbi:carboxypeptidase regulatory-like domain-containing protein [Telmatobacter bradus]|uniref:carboxypeptidase regulatory-like domain-containing protein n=1 Tax=Telmatobacter bradus TaxID=474953 RepID=UPI003B42C031
MFISTPVHRRFGLHAWKISFALFLGLTFFAAELARSQATSATITGTVLDASGAAIPDATVTVTNEGTHVATTRQSNQVGVFDFPALPTGFYTVKAAKAGFNTYAVQKVELHPATTSTVNATLKTANAQTEEVLVTATAAQVELATPEVSSDVAGSQVSALPLNGRNYQALAAVMPGVQNINAGTGLTTGGRSTNNSISVNGGLTFSTVYYLDGIWNENTGNMTQTTIMPNPDSLEEVRVLQDDYSVRYGFLGASVVLLQTRSGSNQFHATAWEYLRNDDLNARNYFSTTVPTLKQNIFGYNVGGPVFIPGVFNTSRDKTHFFWNEQWVINHAQSTQNGYTLTDAQRAGHFTENLKNPLTGTSFPHNVANGYYDLSGYLNASAVAYVNALYPEQNYSKSGSSYNYINNKPAITDQRDDEIKVDHFITPKHHLTGEFLDEYQDYRQNSFNSATSGEVFDVNWEEDYTHNKVFGLSLSSTLTDNLVNTISLSSNIYYLDLTVQGITDVSSLSGYSSSMPYSGTYSTRLPIVTLSGSSTSYSPEGVPASRPLNHADDLDNLISDDLSWQHGRHFFQGGIDIMFNTKRQNVGRATNGQWTFNASYTKNTVNGVTYSNAMADFLTGHAATFTQYSDERRIPVHATIISPYIEDRYKVSKNLTVTAGIRFNHLPLPAPTSGKVTSFLPSAYVASEAPTVSTTGVITSTGYNATNGLITNGVNGVPNNFFNAHNWYFGPNAGFAWDIFGNGKYSLRGGYGLNFSRIFTNQDCSFNCASNPPYSTSANLTSLTFGEATSTGSSASTSIATLYAADPNVRSTQIHSFNLSLEGDLGRNWLASIAGASSQVRHLRGIWNLNAPGHYGAYDFNPAINVNTSYSTYYYAPYQGYSSITTYESRQGQNWNGLEASLKHPVTSSIFFTLAYTWSHNLSNYTGSTFTVVDPYSPSKYYGNTPGYDYRHSASGTLIYTDPWFKKGNRIEKLALSGWQFSDITTLRSGVAIDPGLSYTGQGLASRPDRVAGQSLKGAKTLSSWFNTSAFAKPAQGYYGDSSIGLITGPGIIDFDMALYKDFSIVGSHTVQFRGEAFNVFNHTNFSGIASTLGASNLGQVTSALDPRIFEVALRYKF